MLARKPTWSWLDRLRSSKGLPVTSETDLEQFLNQNPNSPQIQPKSIPNSNKNSNSRPSLLPNQEDEEEKWFSTMSNVLSEIFVMEDSNKPPSRKKSSRKQKTPKVCLFSEETVDNSVAEVKEGEEDELDEERLNLLGFSQSDLVVIDTSNVGSVGWKTEKVVCRKGDVWKIREWKRDVPSSVFVKKKRKMKLVDADEDEEESEEERKKRKRRKKKKMVMMMKKKNKQMGLFYSRLNVSDRAESCGISPFESSPENDNQVANKRSHSNMDQPPTKRGKYLRLYGNPAKKSSLLHI